MTTTGIGVLAANYNDFVNWCRLTGFLPGKDVKFIGSVRDVQGARFSLVIATARHSENELYESETLQASLRGAAAEYRGSVL